MPRYRFEIHGSTDVEIEAKNREDARMQVINKLENGDYNDQLSNASAYVSDGDEIK